MSTETPTLPPIALALGRLRQFRAWPYAPRPAELQPLGPGLRQETMPAHDFLRMLPEPALTGELPPLQPAPAPAIPGPEAARTYWFDL